MKKYPPQPVSGRWILMITLILVFTGCRPSVPKDTAGPAPVSVTLTPVLQEEISLPVRSAGIVATSEEIRLSFKTGGIIARTLVREGDRVSRGQLLAELNLSEINAQVNQAVNAFEKAQRDYDRARNLYTDSVATLEQMQNSETAKNVAKSVLEMARFNQEHSKIHAPKSGVILRQLARENELVAPGYPVFALGVSGKNWIIRTSISDRDIVKISTGDSATVSIDAWPDQPFTAVVSQIDEASNPMTGTYETELVLSPTPFRLASGFIANVSILPAGKKSYHLIPMASIVEADGRTGYVYSVTPEGLARKSKVTITTLRGTQAVVSEGLENIPAVVAGGVTYLTDGTPVTLVK